MMTFLDIIQWPPAIALPFFGGWLGWKLRNMLWDATCERPDLYKNYRGTWKPR